MSGQAILCVDDEPVVLESIKEQLKRSFGKNYYIEVAESGEDALEIFEELQAEGVEVSLIISDQIMPGMKGDELLSYIHTHYPKTVKVLLTGQASAEAVGNAVNTANLYRYIAKPWDEGDLQLTVTEALRSYAQDKQLTEKNEELQIINSQLQKLNASLEEKVEQRTAELAKAKAELLGVFTAMTELIFVIDAQGKYLKVISNNSRLLYQPPEALLGKRIREVFAAQQADTFLRHIQQALATGETVSFEYSLKLGQQDVWFAANISRISADSVIWVARDITERKLLEEKFRSSEQQIRAIFKAMTDIVLVIDEQRVIEVIPTNISHLYSAETDPLNITLEQFFIEERCEIWWNKIQQVLETQQTVSFDYSLSLNEREIWFAASISPMPNNSVIWVARNIDQRKQAETAMQEAKESAEAANRAKSSFLANMSHELRSPLNVILGFSQLLTRSQSLTPEQQQDISIICRSGEHLLTLINNVLDLSKIEAGRTTLNESNFDLYRLLDDLEDMFHLKAEDKGLQLVFECSPNLPQYICADQSKLRQVLINLITNAIKFTQVGRVLVRAFGDREIGRWEAEGAGGDFSLPPHPLTSSPPHPLTSSPPHPLTSSPPPPLTSSPPPQQLITFEVEDTGQGIATNELDYLFEAFVQTQTGIDSQEGTGLGLPIARKFVQLMGGDISVSSQPGQSTIFRFDINIKIADGASIDDKQPSHQVIALEANQPNYRILIVDDKIHNRQLLVRLLEPLGFELQEACNGKEAIAIWQTFEPHLIWMDMRMPVMDGYEATRQIKRHLKGQATAIIALTASTLEEERAVILSTGCDDFVRKPFREGMIFDKMTRYLGVRYIYKELKIVGSEEVETTLGLQESLAAMPAEWVKQLYQAANLIDDEQIFQLLEQIPPTHTSLHQTLNNWVNSFRCDKIIDLVEANIKL
ncbi:MAG: response regulator [Coleofasciculaceae cyanobacterium]